MTSPNGTLRCSAISLLSCSLPRPAKSISFFLVTSSIAVSPYLSSPSQAPALRWRSAKPPPPRSAPLVPFSFALVEPAFRDSRRHVPRDDGAGAGVRLVAHLDRGHQDGVGGDARVLPDLGAVLLAPVIVGGDRPGADVGAVADLGVADVCQVRDLGALADLGVL